MSNKSIVQRSLALDDNQSMTLQQYRHVPKKTKHGDIFNLSKKNLASTGSWNSIQYRTFNAISGQSSFGNTINFEFAESFILKNAYLEVQLAQLTQTGGTEIYYVKSPLLLKDITLITNNGATTIKNFDAQMLYYNIALTHNEESLDAIQTWAGLGSKTQRNQDNTDGNLTYLIPLRGILFNMAFPLFHVRGKLRISFRFRDANEVFTYDGTSPSSPDILKCLLHCEFQDLNRSVKNELVRDLSVKHYRALSPEMVQIAIPSGTTVMADKYLNFNHSSAFFLFKLSKVGAKGEEIVDDNQPIESFSLKDSAGNIISYSNSISATFNRSVMGFTYFDKWVKNNAIMSEKNLYFFPFSERPPVAMLNGSDYGYRSLTGNERISITFPSATSEDLNLFVISYAYIMLQINPQTGAFVVLS